MQIHLKVKCATLAQEQRIIRRYLRSLSKRGAMKAKGSANMKKAWGSLHDHSKIVSSESRHSQLAYGFLRKRPYELMEAQCRKLPDWERIEKTAINFGKDMIDERDLKQRFAAWKDASRTNAEQARKNLLAKDQNSAAERKRRYAANNTAEGRAARREKFAKEPA